MPVGVVVPVTLDSESNPFFVLSLLYFFFENVRNMKNSILLCYVCVEVSMGVCVS